MSTMNIDVEKNLMWPIMNKYIFIIESLYVLNYYFFQKYKKAVGSNLGPLDYKTIMLTTVPKPRMGTG